MRTALPAAIGLIGALLLGADHPDPAVSSHSVIPPCYVPRHMNIEGWQTVRLDSSRTFRLPPGFVRDSLVTFNEGGKLWRSARGEFKIVNGIFGGKQFATSGSPSYAGYSECTDTLAGIPYRLITAYNVRHKGYVTVALPVKAPGEAFRYTSALIGNSPDSSDQRLFLAIFQTLRVDSTGPTK